VISAEQTSQCGAVAALRWSDTGVGRRTGAVVCGGAECAPRGGQRVFSSTFIKARAITLGVGTSRVETAACCGSAAELQLSEDHDGILSAADCAGRQALRRVGRARRSRAGNQPDAQSSGLHRRAGKRDLSAADLGSTRSAIKPDQGRISPARAQTSPWKTPRCARALRCASSAASRTRASGCRKRLTSIGRRHHHRAGRHHQLS